MSKAFASQADLEEKKTTFEQLSEHCWAYTAEGDPNTGVIITDEAVLICDTLASGALVHAVQELETKYETQAKEQKISQLEQEKELQGLRLQRQRAMTYGAGGFALLLLSAGLLAWRFRFRFFFRTF